MFGNIPRSIEFAVSWTTNLIQLCVKNDVVFANAPRKKVDEWMRHLFEHTKGLFANEVDSWMTGVNKNIKRQTEEDYCQK